MKNAFGKSEDRGGKFGVLISDNQATRQKNCGSASRFFYVGIVQDTFLSKDTSHSFLYGKACVFMDKMGEHTATPERAIELQKIGGPLADMCS